ncbi:MAG: stage III sporulation protein AB [Oscillospiraceae bacterium]
MLKLLGGLLLLGCGGAVQLSLVAEHRRELERLTAWRVALERMESDIALSLTPMPRLLARLGTGEGVVGEFFRHLSLGLRRDIPLPALWQTALSALELPAEENAALSRLGGQLEGDEGQVRAALGAARETLASLQAEQKRQRSGREKLSAALCFSAALFVTILLL